jgi:hypothetical protein
LGKADEQAMVRKIGRKLVREINVHTRHFNVLKERLTKAVAVREESFFKEGELNQDKSNE